MSTAILRLENVSKNFQNVDALSDINVEFHSGNVTALIGGNGAGKSTLIKVISGAFQISQGKIYYNGEEVHFKSPYDSKNFGIIVCSQEIQLFNELTIAENIYLGNETLEKDIFLNLKNTEKKVEEILKKLNMDLDIHRKVKHLSLAEKFLIQFARALLSNPKILIIDELIDILTQIECNMVYEIINELKSKNVAVIFITHKIEEAIKFADNILVMREGRIIETIETKYADKETIKNDILGQDLKEHFPKLTVKKGEELLKITNISNRFLNNISFSLRRGEILGIAGLVGSGRTSLLKAIVGLDKVSNGEIMISSEHKNGKKAKTHSNIGFMSESRDIQGFFPSLSIGQNVTIRNLKKISKYHILNPKLEMMKSKDVLDRIGIKCDCYNGNISFLSGGNRQKILVARNVFSKCNIYVFDEPTKGIDIAGKVEIYNIINELIRRGAGIILVSSDFTELAGMCDRVLVIKKGSMSGELMREEITQASLFTIFSDN